jgi:ABC-type nitrate/sulfonate/bicarbonate transport system permease component
MLRGIPAIAIIPFVLIWFGLGEGSKIAVITWAVFFPVWLNVHLGVRGVPVKYVWIAESLGANGRGILVSVILPAALPAIIAGMRTGIGIAYVALFGAEMTGALAGIGYRIYSSYTVYRVDVMVADLIALGVLAALTDALFAWFARSVFPWIAVQSGAGHALANRK